MARWIVSVLLGAMVSASGAKPAAELLAEQLSAYLRNPHPDLRQSQVASSIARQAQMIELAYQPTTPAPFERDPKRRDAVAGEMLETSWRGPAVDPDSVMCWASEDIIGGQTVPRIHAIYSRFRDSYPPKPVRWIEGMRVPLAHGYSVATVHVLPLPPVETRRRTSAELETLVRRLTEELKNLRSRHPQLAGFNDGCARAGAWAEWDREGPTAWPSLEYRFALGPAAKGPVRRDSEAWCELRFDADMIHGGWEQRIYTGATRNYERQGVRVRFSASSEDKEFNRQFIQVVDGLLVPLDQFEAELRTIDEKSTP